MKYLNLFKYAIVLSMFYSCVPTRQFEELKQKTDICANERDSLKSYNEELTVSNTEKASEIFELKKRLDSKSGENQLLSDSINELKNDYQIIEKVNADLSENQNKLMEGNANETRKLLAKLQIAQEDLQKREDDLKIAQRTLNDKQQTMDELKSELDIKTKNLVLLDSTIKVKQNELEERNKKLISLQSVLTSKDSAVNALKSKVSDALLGFENNGLTVHRKNGKVYVSLDEQLLFKFGSTNVDTKGVKALKKLAKVLEQNKDINILIEGHTDNVGKPDYNWDLSAKRATSIVKILLHNSKIDPKRLTAAGRGQYLPVDAANTDEARKKNRRTEIILTPKLDELFQILGNN